MLSTTLEEAYATREWVINEKNETLSLLEVANTKHEITKDMQQSVQKENAELRAKVENWQKLAESSFMKGWLEAKVYFFNADGLLEEPNVGLPLKGAQIDQETSSGLGSEWPPVSSIQLEPHLSVL